LGKTSEQGFAGFSPSLDGAVDVVAASSRQEISDGDSYYWDEGRHLLFVTLKQTHQRTNQGDFCPSEGCNFVWINANPNGSSFPRFGFFSIFLWTHSLSCKGPMQNCAEVAYSGDSIQETTGDWLEKSF
jgi:hypothetical protein